MRERSYRALENGSSAEAEKLWSRLTTVAEEVAEVGGSRTRPELVVDLHAFHLIGSRTNRGALATLFEQSELALLGFEQEVAGVNLLRQERLEAVQGAMERSRYVEIRGDAGVGKSALLRSVAETSSVQARHLVLSPNRILGRGWTAIKAATGYVGDGRDLMTELSLSGVETLFVDNLDFYSAEERVSVGDLVRFASQHPTMRVVATTRLDFGKREPSWLPKDALTRLGTSSLVTLGELSDEEVEELSTSAPSLALLLSNGHPAREIVRNLFRLSRLAERNTDEPWPATEADMARIWWELADGREDLCLRERCRILRKLAKHSLVSSSLFDGSQEDGAAIDELKRSGTIREFGRDQFAFRHDVLREWAFANLFFDEQGFDAAPDLHERASPDLARGAELAARLAVEEPNGIQRWSQLIASLDGAHETWRRAVLLTIVRSENAVKLLTIAGPSLYTDEGAFLRELVRYILAVEFEPAAKRLQGSSIDTAKLPDTWKVPRNRSAAHLVMWSLVSVEHFPDSVLPEVVRLYAAYTIGTLGGDAITRMVLPLLFGWLTKIEADRDTDPYDRAAGAFAGAIDRAQLKVMEEECRCTFLFFCQQTPELARRYLQSFKGKENRESLRIDILKLRGTLSQAAPEDLADFALETFIKKEPRRRRRISYESLPDRAFEYIDTRFLPASPSQGPFLDLLIHAPQEGLRLVRAMIRYAVHFERGSEEDRWQIVLYRGDAPTSYKWPDLYMWAREYGNAPSLVVSALMALEAWGHRRIEAGEDIESVVSDIIADPECSSAVLLTAVDMVISHWPKSADSALAFIGCPELLCLEIARPGHENVEFPDIYGLKDLQKEPFGPVSLASLKQRVSRRASLYGLLPNIAFGPLERREKVRALLQGASARLGKPEKESNLGDPRMMALHALNLLDPKNWVEVIGEDGNPSGQLQYKAPESEDIQMEPIRQEAAPRLEDNSLLRGILDELFTKSDTSEEFLTKALQWAKKRENVFDNRPEFDSSGEFLATSEAVVSAATLLARNGSTKMLEEEGSWIRSVFQRAYEGNDDPVFSHRDGLRFNPPAIAFTGQVLLLHRSFRAGDDEKLLRFACDAGYGAAHGYKLTLHLLQKFNARIIASLMRCAFEGAIRPDIPWDASDQTKNQRNALLAKRVSERIAIELNWLRGEGVEPAWPSFPVKRPRRRPPLRLSNGETGPDVSEPQPKDVRVNYQLAALWLRHSRELLGAIPVGWLTDMVNAYLAWTQQANGYGGDKKERFERGPSEWNASYFEAAARCMGDLSESAFAQRLRDFFSELPDEPLMDTLTPFLRSADVGYLDFRSLSAEQLIQVRSFVIAQLQTTRMFSWNKNRDETSVTSDIAPVFAAICFNIYNAGFAPSTCFVPPNLIPDTDPFLPLLEDFVAICRSPFLTLHYLNFFEVVPHESQLSCIVGCSERWLVQFPEDDQFWVEWGVGKRISKIFIAVLKQAPNAFATGDLRSKIDHLLSRLVGLGVNEAHEMEQLLYKDAR